MTLVLSDNGTDEEVSALLERYDENREVPKYKRECWCVGEAARSEGFHAASSELAPLNAEIERLRKRARELRRDLISAAEGELDAMDVFGVDLAALPDAIRKMVGDRPGLDELEPEAKEVDAKFDEVLEERRKTIERHVRAHPLYGKPDANCEECGGSGRTTVTINPEGYWDWWVIGGRWEGMLDPDYDPDLDPRNFKTCEGCGGAGVRSAKRQAKAQAGAANGSAEPDAQPGEEGSAEADCHRCRGTGMERRFDNAPHPEGNHAPAEKVADMIESEEIYTPYALVTRDGEWHTQGEMGWFGISNDKMTDDEWKMCVLELLRADPEATVTVVDCHV